MQQAASNETTKERRNSNHQPTKDRTRKMRLYATQSTQAIEIGNREVEIDIYSVCVRGCVSWWVQVVASAAQAPTRECTGTRCAFDLGSGTSARVLAVLRCNTGGDSGHGSINSSDGARGAARHWVRARIMTSTDDDALLGSEVVEDLVHAMVLVVCHVVDPVKVLGL